MDVPVARRWAEVECGLNLSVETAAAAEEELLLLSLVVGSVMDERVASASASGALAIIEDGFHKFTVPSSNPPASIPLLLLS